MMYIRKKALVIAIVSGSTANCASLQKTNHFELKQIEHNSEATEKGTDQDSAQKEHTSTKNPKEAKNGKPGRFATFKGENGGNGEDATE